jgi:tetratricopeptide (TPR) repeat protein
MLFICSSLADEKTQHQLKLDTIVKLLSESSVSKNILSSKSDIAIQYFKLAKTAYKYAVDEFENGDIEKSNLFIKKATDALSDATMFANMNKKDVNLEVDRHHYQEIQNSVEALLQAVRRVSEEKGVGEENQEMLGYISELKKRGEAYAADEKYTEATRDMEQILSLIRSNIIKMKMGDTLVRTLTFANPKEEFRYELDRNDAHFLLLKTFLPEQQARARGNGAYSGDTLTAYQLRKEAEASAEKKDYKQAIHTLEKSTTILINIIRMAGTKIPG